MTQQMTRTGGGPTRGTCPQSADQAGSETVRLLGWGLSVPAGTSFRLDQPCVQQHGSLGGWHQDAAGEVAFTILWRPLHYWSGPGGADDQGGELQDGFVRQALSTTRRDGRRVVVHEQGPLHLETAGHGATLLDLTIGVRRRLSSVRLRRRQALWTCTASGRHLAFEVSAMEGEATAAEELFARILPTVTCHETVRASERG